MATKIIFEYLPASTKAGMSKDPDLAPLRGNPRFEALLAGAKKNAVETAKAP